MRNLKRGFWKDVCASQRLTGSAACLVDEEDGIDIHLSAC